MVSSLFLKESVVLAVITEEGRLFHVASERILSDIVMKSMINSL